MKTDVSIQRFLHLWLFPGKKSIIIKKQSEKGLTLLETLVGILIITLVLAASTPPILIATASRIQNRRAEQAIQIAQQEVDKVRLIMERDDSTNEELPPAVTGKTRNNINTVNAANSICTTCTYDSYAAINQFKRTGDFLVQVFREPGIKETDIATPDPTGGQDRVMAFRIGVRVYSKVAEANLSSLETDASSLQMTNAFGQQTKKPLAVLYADFSRPDLTLSLKAYRRFTN